MEVMRQMEEELCCVGSIHLQSTEEQVKQPDTVYTLVDSGTGGAGSKISRGVQTTNWPVPAPKTPASGSGSSSSTPGKGIVEETASDAGAATGMDGPSPGIFPSPWGGSSLAGIVLLQERSCSRSREDTEGTRQAARGRGGHRPSQGN